jgi:uncharacterized membrane protein
VKRTTYVAQAGVIAAVYAVFTLVMIQNPLGYGPVQLRLSEAVTVLAALTPAAVPGLLLGSIVANSFMVAQFGAVALLDVVFGSLGTLLGALWTWRLWQRPALALLGPVITNALIVPAYLPVLLAATGFYDVTILHVDVASSWPTMYAFGVITVAAGQSLVIYGLGLPLLLLLKRLGVGGSFGRTGE